jgi:pseudouridine-5'-phosphate glycosidase
MSSPLSTQQDQRWFQVNPPVQRALDSDQAIVAFETTVLSFGLPHPANLQVGQQCESLVRQSGGVPATLGVVDGSVQVGISDEQMRRFCAAGERVTKVNLQNFAAAMVRRELGAFTVAASMQVCAASGIKVFSTGGIGGVHTDFARFHDVSSDMTALSRYPVAVVCAGVKSILDVPATLEQLETLGVPVIGYKTSKMPLFHARESLHDLEVYSDSLDEIADIVRAHWKIGGGGVLIVTPVPAEHAIDVNQLQEWIAQAHRAAQTGRVSGRAVTPFLLKKLEELSHGRSLTSNVALLENNALVAAGLAKVMAAKR